ncbi:M1 family metallopeptidase [Kroppenstedtia eburnea]|uniref:Peptidase family M1 n=1 Tax=Kroppenstedtia eburnea TaxID=714067 RepID=A0A1N7PRG3_9BACL|nr:M1 family metallopeptidase [Kroppenstedtia eburnea]QKI82699.1 M1 family metallopeptidase [Kroppenstedtia eburnea]SIT13125.1 Peptidase family M1 [Kroppenstedtia eburnea]
MKRRFLSCLTLISMLGSLFVGVGQAEGQTPGEQPERPRYSIRAKYDDQTAKVTGDLSVKVPVTGEPMTRLYFHLYPNAFANWKWGKESKPKQPGYLKVKNVKADGVKAIQQTKETLLEVRLPKPVQPGQSVQVKMDYELKLPKGGTRLNQYKNTAFLAQWYPMLAVKDKEGWHTDPYTTTGDPFYTRISDFEVTFEVPEGYRLITTASDSRDPVMKPVTLRQDRVRDFAAVISKDYEPVEGKAGEIQVNLWYLKGMEDVAQELHDAAVSGMEFFSKRFGPYPYKEVDVVLGETGYGIAGMEYPGLVTSVDKIPTRKGERPAVNVVAHELAHQWWYAVVGNNQVKEPWLDEGLTTFSEFLFMQEKMGEDERGLLVKAAERTDQIHKEKGVTSVESLYKYSDPIYGLMVYTRPAAMMWALMDELGKDQVMKILSTYYSRYRFQTATTEDFIRVANEVAGKDLQPFFDRWLFFKPNPKSGKQKGAS